MSCFTMTSLQSSLPTIKPFNSLAQRPHTVPCFSGFSRPGRLPLRSESYAPSLLSFPQNGCKWTAMRHGNKKVKLGRPADQRKALLRSLTTELLRHGKIKTTKVKAKAMRKPVDKMITLAKNGTLHARRQALAYIYDKAIVTSLFAEVPQRYSERPGGPYHYRTTAAEGRCSRTGHNRVGVIDHSRLQTSTPNAPDAYSSQTAHMLAVSDSHKQDFTQQSAALLLCTV